MSCWDNQQISMSVNVVETVFELTGPIKFMDVVCNWLRANVVRQVPFSVWKNMSCCDNQQNSMSVNGAETLFQLTEPMNFMDVVVWQVQYNLVYKRIYRVVIINKIVHMSANVVETVFELTGPINFMDVVYNWFTCKCCLTSSVL